MEVNIIASAAPSPENPLRQRVLVDGRHVLYTDEPVSVGGSDSTCSPHELLAAALAACATTMAALAAHQRGWSTEGLAADVSYDPQLTPRRFELKLMLPAGADARQRAIMERAVATCPVKRALTSEVEIITSVG